MQSIAMPSIRRVVSESIKNFPPIWLTASQSRSYKLGKHIIPTTNASAPSSSGQQTALVTASRQISFGKPLYRNSNSSDTHTDNRIEPCDPNGFTEADIKNPPKVPSRQQYDNYEDYLNAYDQYLQKTKHFFTSARVSLQKRLWYLHAAHAHLDESVRWEYFWTFVPFMLTLCIHMVDTQHHANARITRERLKQRTKAHVKDVKWVSV